MATTTNYNWSTPDDTSLVKDGAAAIRTLGSSIDTTTKALNPSTTLGDIEYRSSTANTNTRLPIGTTGQVLAVVGGVPAWATTADQTPLTTKGDIFTFTTVDARLGVGANGTVLTADSAEASGLKWVAPAGLTYTTWTPTTTGITVGNGTLTARYAQSGKFVTGSFIFVLGSTSAITSAGISFTLPVETKSIWNFNYAAALQDVSVEPVVGICQADPTIVYVGCVTASTSFAQYASINASQPFTFTTNDKIVICFSYEAA